MLLHGLCYIWLILAGLVPYTKCSDSGCDDWTISVKDSQEVCCNKCKPGNRLVKNCGKDPELLCRPCEANKYTTNPKSYSCNICTQCIGPQFTIKPCNIRSDTVCGCKAGYRCGDERCSHCVTECKTGEEPTTFRSCAKCPEGNFNDKIHSMCKKWKASCPNGQVLDNKGNAFRDHECIVDNEVMKINKITKSNEYEKNSIDNTLLVVSGKKQEKMNWIPVCIAGFVAMLAVLCFVASVTTCVKARSKKKEPKAVTSDQELSEDSRIMVVDQEACSFRHPEQEQGGSSESISTQDSESKLIV
ncbi:tumor necrosis factor receptor superfamily member 9a [Triplophysa dalaica]|uniref:tumor necrosis factor receptor superfamily member 9a n=1 Tax=Triplophysa dalaica TaxID=1582913 RepID=UPI0024DF5E53|nr:tumor necrosis factor receptor superfamily member 9a [Triplophysa dalaica]XP_056588901.1 tumor necrosis factor receptor superfamily member 9a [Triplophysa dalaica]